MNNQILNKKSVIYGLSSSKDNVIRYIGRTTKPLGKRLSEHLYEARHPERSQSPDTHKLKWIRFQEDKKFVVQIHLIEETDYLNQNEREQYWIAYYGRKNLVNGTDGGITVNVKKYKKPSVSFEKARTCLKSNRKKLLLAIVQNVHYTRHGSYSDNDVLNNDLRLSYEKKYDIKIKKNITVSEFIDFMKNIINNVVLEYVNNLNKLYKTERGKQEIEFAYSRRLLQKAKYIPETIDAFENMIFNLFMEELGFDYYEDIL